jgi:lysozyme
LSKSLRERALDRALANLGVREHGYNRGPEIDRWNRLSRVPLGSSYCASFVHAMYLDSGFELPGDLDAYCPSVCRALNARYGEVRRPRRCDLVFFDWNQDGILDHVGFVERVLSLRWNGKRFVGLVQTIEANTSSGLSGSQSDGDGVFRRRRWVNASTRFARVDGATDLSEKGVEFIARREGFVDHAYNDPAGHATIGFGHLLHLGAVTAADRKKWGRISRASALRLLRADAAPAVRAIREKIERPLAQHEFDALVSFLYNVGPGGIDGTSVARAVESGGNVRAALAAWVHAGGKVLPGLVARRKAEADLYEQGRYEP